MNMPLVHRDRFTFFKKYCNWKGGIFVSLFIVLIGGMITLGYRGMRITSPLSKVSVGDNRQVPRDHVVTLTPGKHITVRIADTEERRRWGLSHFSYLEPDSGMMFLFPNAQYHGFWMKDMEFPIDIIWLAYDHVSHQYRVVSLKEHVTPDSYPEIMYPTQPSDAVLEIGAGMAHEWGITLQTEGVLTD